MGDVVVVDVALPLRLNHAWVAYACQKASLPRPRWDHRRREWLIGGVNVVTIDDGKRTARLSCDEERENELRTLVSNLVTGMMQRTRSSPSLGR